MKHFHLDHKRHEKPLKDIPPVNQEDIFTSRKHGMDYFTVDGVILRTGYKNKRDWYLLPIREMLDNDADFLWKYYKGDDNASITVRVTMDDELFRVTIRNSNHNNIPVFSELRPIFDYDMRYGSKQDVHIISRGMLGDAMKQILSLGYVLLHTSDDGTAFTDKQWKYPLIIRHNQEEWKINLHVDKARQIPYVIFDQSPEEVTHTDTEIELVLPVIDEVRNGLNRNYIEQFCRKYSILTTDISFKFRIIDDITHDYTQKPEEYAAETYSDMNPVESIKSELITALSTAPEKAILNIDVPALHPIATEEEWNNSNNIHSYKPEEFINRITNVHDKDSTSVYNALLIFREGSNIKKTAENQITVAELLADPHKDQKIEALFHQLKDTLDPPKELSLPYRTNTKKRTDALVTRIVKLYDIDKGKKPSYKLIRGFYDDTLTKKVWTQDHKNYSYEKGKGMVQYPFVFEVIAIPLNNPIGPEGAKSTEIITAVNYSVSPRDNTFEGDYEWLDKKGYRHGAENIRELLEMHGFHTYSAPKSRLPSIIVANLITPRRDPQGYDKSSIDTQPFAQTIATGINKMAAGIQTYRAAGYKFERDDDYRTGRQHDINTKISAKNLLKQFLIENRGLPALKRWVE